MKIITISSLFPNKINQKVRFVLNRVKSLSKCAQIEVIAPVPYFPFVTINRPRGIPSKEVIDGITVYHPKYFSIPKFFKSLDGFFFYLSLRKFKEKIKHADIIDAHFAWPDGYGAWLMAKKQDKPFSITLLGSDANYTLKDKSLQRKIVDMLDGADVVLAVSDKLRKEAKKFVNREIDVVANGVDTKTFRPVLQSKARKELGIPSNKKIILSVGRPYKLKGFYELAESTKDKDVIVYLIGNDEPGRKEFETFLNKRKINNVKIIKQAKHEELHKWYSAADIFVLASHSEGWPNVVMEALACGKPCVVTEEAAGEFITPELGIVTNYKKLSADIDKALARKWNTKKIIDFAKQNSWDRGSKKIYELFTKTLEK